MIQLRYQNKILLHSSWIALYRNKFVISSIWFWALIVSICAILSHATLHYIILQGEIRSHHAVEARNNVYPSILNVIFPSNAILHILKKNVCFTAPKTKTIRNILEIVMVIESSLVTWTVFLPLYPDRDIYRPAVYHE